MANGLFEFVFKIIFYRFLIVAKYGKSISIINMETEILGFEDTHSGCASKGFPLVKKNNFPLFLLKPSPTEKIIKHLGSPELVSDKT